MLNLFKKHRSQNQDAQVSIEERIHHDVYSAQEILLKEATSILSKPSNFNEQEYERLSKLNELGFSNAEQVKAFKTERDRRQKQKVISEKIGYYSQSYPLHKFIDKDTVSVICKKYKLLLALANDYIAEIPVKNQNEIINFKIRRKDIRQPYEIMSGLQFFSFHNHDLPDFILLDSNERSKYYNELIGASDLLIIAPEHKLNISNREKVGHVLRIKDPIVLQPVHEGYLIVSSWGLEASDELIVNSINN